jgi:plasmid stabilization system protein ParE
VKSALDLAAGSLPVAELGFLPAAQADYEEALAWYQARSVRAADGFEAAVANGVQRISDQPDFYR